MKINKKKALKLEGMVNLINKMLMDKAREGITDYFDRSEYNEFSIEFHFFDRDVNCEFKSEKVYCEKDSVNSYIAWGGHRPSTVYLYDDLCRYEEFDSVVSFIRAAVKNNGLDGMKFGQVKVVSEMTDYLDFTVES